MGTILLLFIILLAIAIISAIPLFLAMKILGGRGGIFRVIFVNLLVALVTFLVKYYFQSWLGGLFAFILMIWIYKDFFRLGWLRALLAWLLQFVVVFLLVLLLGLVGITVPLL